MTPEKLTRIEDMRSRGKSYRQIATAIGMSPGAVSWYCLKHAIEPPRPRRPRTGIVGPAAFKRGNHVVRQFLPEEDARLLELEASGASRSAIARDLRRAVNSISGRLMVLARREERASA